MPGLFFYNYQHCNHSSLLRGKTYEGIKNGDLDLFASIHFPLAREDPRDVPFIVQPTEASIHFLLRGKTSPLLCFLCPLMLQSTSLLRGKTVIQNRECIVELASIHFPLAREDGVMWGSSTARDFASIHFPLAREDGVMWGSSTARDFASIHFPLAREDRSEWKLS